jgi:hypothetical protein
MFANEIAAQLQASAMARRDSGELYEVSFVLDGNSGKQIFANGFEVRRFEFDIEFNGGEIVSIEKIR